ncbi:ribonuclease H-like protein [Lasiosphaeria hispida]|uniref:Ribonuclease H n=1 Tax=Lasiosphaeria hispida TaxID=260671 RepID=A0AAJ0HEA0_9PEZI|nr:ribonuclease H-like protein [Lasiosphaeria hispida]
MPTTNKKAAMPASSRSALAKAVVAREPPSKKRKMDANEQKYYAVRSGFKPGVYTSWAICQQQISGFKGAQFKSFLSFEDASAFAAGRDPPSTSSDKPERFYGVAVGRKPGVYTDWTKAQEAIVGWKGPKYKKFDTRAQAEAFVRSFTRVASAPGDSEGEDDDDEEPPAKKAKKELPKGKKEPPKAGLSKDGTRLVIYTDGASSNNGKAGARAGVGVYFGHGDNRNISEPLEGMPQTNQRAEMAAILRALEVADETQEIEICSDSSYSIDALTQWYRGWERNGWVSTGGKAVMNQDLIKPALEIIQSRKRKGTETIFTKVDGHKGIPGNEAADRLAVAGRLMKI